MIAPEDRQMALDLVAKARSEGARLVPACAELGITSRTYRRWRHQAYDRRVDRTDPDIAQVRRLTPEERERIVSTCNEPRFASLPPSQIVPCLADEGVYIASESSVYRVLRERQQNNRRGRAQHRQKPTKPKAVTVTEPGRCYTWDITYLPTMVSGLFYKLYCIIDLYSRKIVGWEIHDRESSELARDLIYKTQLRENVKSSQLVIHSDNGAPMKGVSLKTLMESLGITASYSRPSVSNDNAFSESLFRTVKYCPQYPERPFESLEAARLWMHEFVHWYNIKHRHSALKFVTPNERHTGRDSGLLAERVIVYEAAKQRHPHRWSGHTRNWQPSNQVTLNPEKQKENAVQQVA